MGDNRVEGGGQQGRRWGTAGRRWGTTGWSDSRIEGGETARWRDGKVGGRGQKVEEQQCGGGKFGSGGQQDGGDYKMGDSRVEGSKVGGTVRWGADSLQDRSGIGQCHYITTF